MLRAKVKTGRPARLAADIDADLERQLRESYKVDEDGCWIWTGLLWDNGYGRFSGHRPASKYKDRAHIASFQLHKGRIPRGLFVCHSCDKKACIRPKHLWLGTNQQNQLDAVEKRNVRK